ncbi:uncharacterized protein TNCV_1276281 [Trichonephila clavipes]|nr:uncharacterized protein TNCV_1276281 [Trichonephila clavipes]
MGAHMEAQESSKEPEFLYATKRLDQQTIGGKGRLTDVVINRLTTFYGNAIRGNPKNVHEMRQAIWAVWAHTASTDEQPKHWFCPKGNNSWCKYNVCVQNNKVQGFKHKNNLPEAVSKAIKPIFKDLSHLKLLRRCLGGKTQNPNESLNSLIWKYSPKTIGSSITVTRIAAFLAVFYYNDGHKSQIDIMNAMVFFIDLVGARGKTKIPRGRIEIHRGWQETIITEYVTGTPPSDERLQ